MRWSRRACAVSSLLGSTLVYAIPSPNVDDQSSKRFIVERAPLAGDITIASGFAAPVTAADASPTPTQNQNNNSGNGNGNGGANANNNADTQTTSTPIDNAAAQTNPSPTPAHDTLTDASTNHFNDITTTSGFANQSGGASVLANHSDTPAVTLSHSTSSAQHSSLAPAPAQSSGTNHGVLIGVVAGGVVLGVVALTVGLWLCYRRRGPTSGASTPRYDTATAGYEDEKPSFFAFLRNAATGNGTGKDKGKRAKTWKKGHLRVKSSQSFASPMIANDPKAMEEVARTRTRTLSVKEAPALPPHLTTAGLSGAATGSRAAAGVGVSGTVTGRDRWSTFSSSDASLQTPVGPNRLDGIIMETVIETDGPSPTNPHTPHAVPFGVGLGGIPARQRQSQSQQNLHNQSSIDYLDLKRTPSHDRSPFDSNPYLPPLTVGSRMSKVSQSSFYRDETDLSSPSTPTSSGGLTYGSNGRPRRTSDRYTFTQPLLTTNTVTPNVSYPTISTHHQHQAPSAPYALVQTRPKFNPTHTNKSGVSVGAKSGNSGNSANETIRITNPFLGGDEDDLSSYGHGMIEADHLDHLAHLDHLDRLDHLDHLDMIKGDEDAMSLNSTDTGILAYPSSTGCLPNKPSPSPNAFANPLRSVNPALIEADAAAKTAANTGTTAGAPRASTSSTQTPSYSSYTTHPRSSMISDSSSDYPYPLGYAIDHEGNVANPFLRISEILEEVDGRMRWPSPPLLPRSESPNY